MNREPKFVPYLVVTAAYILALLFIIGDQPTDVFGRFWIVLMWVVVMGFTFVLVNHD